jgi:hypothetical protein
MADMMSTLQLGLKTDFRDHLQNTIPLKAFLIKRIRSAGKSYKVGGRDGEAVWSIEQEYGYGLGAHAEGGDLNPAYADLFENYVVPLPRFNIAMEFTTDAMAYTRKSSTKFFSETLLRRKIKVVQNIAQHFLATGCWMNGDGIYGEVPTDAASTGTQYPTTSSFIMSNPGAIWLRRGMRIVFEDQADLGTPIDNSGAGFRVVGIDRTVHKDGTAEDVVKLDTAHGLTNTLTYNVYLHNRFSGVTEMNGVGNLISNTGTVGGVDRSVAGKEFAQSWVNTTTGALTEMALQELNDLIRDYGPNVEYAAEFAGASVDVRELFEVLAGRHRFLDNREMTAGYQSLMVYTGDGAKPLHSDPYAPAGSIYAFTPSQWIELWPEGEEGGTWLDEDGNILKLKVASSGQGRAAAYQGYWEMRPQLFVDDYQCQGLVTGYDYTASP